MHLSQSAVSNQIKKLEEHLGVQLFERLPNCLMLTKAGELYAEPVRQALDILSNATVEVVEYKQRTDLRLQMPAVFVAWLKPRLAEFNTHHPQISICLQKLEHTLLLGEPVDMAVIPAYWDIASSSEEHMVKDHFNLKLISEGRCELPHWCLGYLRERESEPAIRVFRQWLLAEVANCSPPLADPPASD